MTGNKVGGLTTYACHRLIQHRQTNKPNMTASSSFYYSVIHSRFLNIPKSQPTVMNPSKSLVSRKPSDSGLHVQLHPLVLLTISDHITRHTARQQKGPIIGGLLGQQNGREITLEHAFECPVTVGPNNEIILVASWFEGRLQQCTWAPHHASRTFRDQTNNIAVKDVHKNPPLDLVGWWSIAPPTGPDNAHVALHQQILEDYNESAVFLTFHPSQLHASDSHGAKLPLAVYESVYEGEPTTDSSKDMQIDGEEQALNIRFRELPYSVETGESEMIGIDTIVQTSGTASLNATQEPTKRGQKTEKDKDSTQAQLSQEEEEREFPLTPSSNSTDQMAQ